ncbi:amidohydrolase [Peptoniphilus equinus]|uniref:Amidohydrolase n=1 Tax=Peptoniphilus equinus TaxID=3016343 RepID=A0ABY7QUS8_9FIRM|nr:amidohydrolase [Peptoniphilus equinus]WBW49648.1 amidohydrolase [Peptoniphilus equinus]
MDLHKALADVEDYIIAHRRYLHQHPETSFKEVETTKYIAAELDKLGVAYDIPTEEPKTGVIAYIDGTKEGPKKAVALRADIDALNVTEATDLDFKSQNVGAMHACGHDAHAAMLLGAAKVLSEHKEAFPGRVYLIFQPAEEVGTGAEYMMRQGTWFDEIESIYGSHVWNNLEVGKINVEAGPRMAAADWFTIKIHGKSGHGSQPHETIDAVLVGAEVVNALQQLTARNYNAFDPCTVVVGRFESGNRFNIIAGEAELEGTNRYFSREISDRIEGDFHRVVKGICDAYGATYDMDYNHIIIPTINWEHETDIARGALTKVAGDEAFKSQEKVTGGEDFSYYLEKKPGVFAFVGTYNPEKGCDAPHHNEHFNVDESALKNGAGMYVQYAIDALNQ